MEKLKLNSNSKINIVGSAGAGKSTVSQFLSAKYGLKHIRLDDVFWNPGWIESTQEEFADKVRSHLSNTQGWIVDGGTPVRDVFWKDLEIVLWLDYSLPLVFYRVFKRTFMRVFITKELICNGNRETFFQQYFTNKSILYFTLKLYFERKRFFKKLFAEPRSAHLIIYRIKNPKELDSLLNLP